MRVGVVFIHGIGSDVEGGYSNVFQRQILDDGYDSVFSEVNWQTLVEGGQKSLFKRCTKNAKYTAIRQLMSSYAGDAVAYQPGSEFYRQVHSAIAGSIANIQEQGVDRLFIVAHSLGTVICSNFLWDVTDEMSMGNRSFRLKRSHRIYLQESLEGVFFFGSPISVWSSKYDGGGECTNFASFKSLKCMINVYSKYDVVSWPLKCINESYRAQDKVQDVQRAYGRFPWNLLPISHVLAWSDKGLARFFKDGMVHPIKAMQAKGS